MATYRVIQDIEAEDKLLGPLSLRQFIYAVIVVILGYVMFRLFMVQPLLAVPFLPPAILFGILAAPFGHDQSSEIWLLAKIRFMLKPRLRIWDQSGTQELVKVTAPKKIEEIRTDGLDETQVKSRLEALAQTIDTRGWAIKGVDVNLYTNPAYANQTSDRLVAPESLAPNAVPDVAINPTDDILDTRNNPVAAQMQQLVQANAQSHREAMINRMQEIRAGQAQSAAPQQAAAQATISATPVAPLPPLPPLPTANAYGNTPVLQPTTAPKTPMKEPAKPAILELAHNDDLSVATIARQANKPDLADGSEVVISLR